MPTSLKYTLNLIKNLYTNGVPINSFPHLLAPFILKYSTCTNFFNFYISYFLSPNNVNGKIKQYYNLNFKICFVVVILFRRNKRRTLLDCWKFNNNSCCTQLYLDTCPICVYNFNYLNTCTFNSQVVSTKERGKMEKETRKFEWKLVLSLTKYR